MGATYKAIFCMGREMCYCLPGGLQDKHKIGWTEVSRLIWYRIFLPDGSPPDICKIMSCQRRCFWLKWRHDVNHLHIHQKFRLITVLANFSELLFDEVFKDSCMWSQFASGARIMEGSELCCNDGPTGTCFQFVPLWNFLVALSLIELSAWFPVMSIQLSH